MEESSSEKEEEEFYKEVMGNQLRPKYKGAHKVLYELEKILGKLEREILSVAWDN